MVGSLFRDANKVALPGVADWQFTGSRIYGAPRPDSDLDVVVQLHPEWKPGAVFRGWDSATSPEMFTDADGYASGRVDATFRYGMVNVIVVSTDKQMKVWRDGTRELFNQARIEDRPRTRDEAITVFQRLEEELLA